MAPDQMIYSCRVHQDLHQSRMVASEKPLTTTRSACSARIAFMMPHKRTWSFGIAKRHRGGTEESKGELTLFRLEPELPTRISLSAKEHFQLDATDFQLPVHLIEKRDPVGSRNIGNDEDLPDGHDRLTQPPAEPRPSGNRGSKGCWPPVRSPFKAFHLPV